MIDNIEVQKLEETVARVRASLKDEAGPEVFQRIHQFLSVSAAVQGVALGQLARADFRVRDALYALSLAEEQRIKLHTLLDQLGLQDQFVGLKYPATTAETITKASGMALRFIERSATEYSVSAKIIIDYVSKFGALPSFCRKDFKPGPPPVAKGVRKPAKAGNKRTRR